MSMQERRIWKRDIKQFAEMCHWTDKTTVMNIRLQCDEKLKRVIEAEFGDGWIDLAAEQGLAAVEAILRKASNPAREKEKLHCSCTSCPGKRAKPSCIAASNKLSSALRPAHTVIKTYPGSVSARG